MAVKTETKTITMDGESRELTVTQLPAMVAVRLFARLGRIVGPALALMLKGGQVDKDGHVLIDETKISAAISSLFEHATEAELESLIKVLLFDSGARVQVADDAGQLQSLPVKDVFASAFAGDMGAVADAVGFALKVNYGNFFSGLGALQKRAAQLLKTAPSSKAPNTSVGQPNG